jgi:hypothetical protein
MSAIHSSVAALASAQTGFEDSDVLADHEGVASVTLEGQASARFQQKLTILRQDLSFYKLWQSPIGPAPAASLSRS